MNKKVKKKNKDEWLKELNSEKFQEVFIEWYLPAIKSKFYELEDRIKKLEKPGK